MQNAIISIIYHSINGHTEKAAELLGSFLQSPHVMLHLIRTEDVAGRWADLHASDTIIFGSPTYFGNVSAAFKAFMESTGSFWYRQTWKNKFAGAFTVSSTVCGDKANTLQSIAIFAAQHAMHWINLGVLPRFCNDQQTDGQNRLASYQGLMIQSDNSNARVEPFQSGDVLTIELFANRILDVTLGSKNIPIGNFETIRS